MKAKSMILVGLLVAAGLYEAQAAQIFVSKLNDSQVEKLMKGLTNKNVNPAQLVAAVTQEHGPRAKS